MSGALNISSLDGDPIFDPGLVISSLVRCYGEESLGPLRESDPPFDGWWVFVEPGDESPFEVEIDSSKTQVANNGVPAKGEVFAASLARDLPEGSRILAVDMRLNSFQYIRSGVTLSDVRSGWRPLDEFDE